MPQQHFTPRDIPFHGIGTRAYWAVQPAAKAVVFVHGFGGEAVDTWEDFAGMLPAMPASAGTDLFFYGYDGRYTRARVSAVQFKDFLVDLLEDPHRLLAAGFMGQSPRAANFAYDSVTVVAHSLGSVVSRQALLEAGSDKRPWLGKLQLVLFAPAHMGADVLKLAAEAIIGLGPVGAIAAAVTKWRWQVLQDLEPGSQTLALLQSESAAAIQQGATWHVARKVILGARDDVVSPNRFCQDPSPMVVPGARHTDVCKPKPGFALPATEVAAVL